MVFISTSINLLDQIFRSKNIDVIVFERIGGCVKTLSYFFSHAKTKCDRIFTGRKMRTATNVFEKHRQNLWYLIDHQLIFKATSEARGLIV